MEDLHRTHKEVPFGWFSLLQDFLAARARRKAYQAPRRRWDTSLPTIPGDLHHLAGPH
ncbi:MAG: hypothetical protein Q7T61_14025 [Caulobacter sp.]|nr:hypothetical protein [Caulobacter sp.]